MSRISSEDEFTRADNLDEDFLLLTLKRLINDLIWRFVLIYFTAWSFSSPDTAASDVGEKSESVKIKYR